MSNCPSVSSAFKASFLACLLLDISPALDVGLWASNPLSVDAPHHNLQTAIGFYGDFSSDSSEFSPSLSSVTRSPVYMRSQIVFGIHCSTHQSHQLKTCLSSKTTGL